MINWPKDAFATLNEILVKYSSKSFWFNISEFVVPYLRMIDFYYKMRFPFERMQLQTRLLAPKSNIEIRKLCHWFIKITLCYVSIFMPARKILGPKGGDVWDAAYSWESFDLSLRLTSLRCKWTPAYFMILQKFRLFSINWLK